MSTIRLSALSVLVALSGSVALASPQLEDYEGALNPFFNHMIGAHEVNGIGPTVNFQDFEFVSPTHSFFIVGTDTITFNLGADESVNSAQVWMKGYGASATFRLIGVDAADTALDIALSSPQSGPFVLYTSTGLGFSRVDEIHLSGLEGAFDDLRVNVIPEPATLALLGGAVLAARRRRS